MSEGVTAGGGWRLDGGWRSPRRAPLLADAVVLAAGVSVGRHPAGPSLLPAMRHGVALGARLCLQGTKCSDAVLQRVICVLRYMCHMLAPVGSANFRLTRVILTVRIYRS